MLFTPNNTVRRCSVVDVESRLSLRSVVSIDTDHREVAVCAEPFRLDPAKGEVVTETIRFRSIYPIYGGGRLPLMFHCYGRQS